MSLSKNKHTSFREEWMLDHRYSWIKPHPKDRFSAICGLCTTVINLSNMGKQALDSHASGKKHISRAAARNSSLPIQFFSKVTTTETTSTTTSGTSTSTAKATTVTAPATSADTVTTEGRPERTSITPQPGVLEGPSAPSCSCCCKCNIGTSSAVKKFLVKDDVSRAEIWACLHCVMYHMSLRSVESGIKMQKIMYHDSDIAQKVQLGRTKIAYTIVHGIAPYFENELRKQIQDALYVVIGFDESLNKIAVKQQMDFCVRFWDNVKEEVVSRYLTSAFLGHSSALDLLAEFKNNLSDDVLKKILQVSMDGPNVNFKFLRELKAYLSEGRPDAGEIIDIGCCGLHTVHGAFKTGAKNTGWGVVQFLRGLHNLFDRVPTRRADYIRITKSEAFPKKFCAVRWLENEDAANVALSMLPSVILYVKSFKGKNEPRCNSFSVVKECVSDKLLGPKLAFFSGVAADIAPFLREFQTDEPMAPFLYNALVTLMERLMCRFVKEDVLKSPNFQVMKIDLSEQKNLLPAKNVNIGYGTKAAFRNVEGASDKDKLVFKNDCLKFLVGVVSALQKKRSPLSYALTKGISFLDPTVASSPNVASARLNTALQIFVEAKWLSGSSADCADRDFKRICAIPHVKSKLESYKRADLRLDKFWMNIFENNASQDTPHLVSFCKMIFILSHGNAALERGFSVNKECLVENQTEVSLVAQRVVYDAVVSVGGMEKVCITKSLVQYARNAYSVYKDYLEKQRKDRAERQLASDSRKRLAAARKELEEKKRKIEEEYNREKLLINDQLNQLK